VVKNAEAPARRKGSFRLNSSNEMIHILINSFPVSRGIKSLYLRCDYKYQVISIKDKGSGTKIIIAEAGTPNATIECTVLIEKIIAIPLKAAGNISPVAFKSIKLRKSKSGIIRLSS
jgi:hypothetical protein